NWFADYPDPNDFVNVLMDPSFGNDFSHFDDPGELARMQSVDSIPAGSSRYAEYQKLDLELARSFAPMTAFATVDASDFFSARISCETFNPYFGMDLAALCRAPDFTVSVSLTASPSSVTAGGSSVPQASVPQDAIGGGAAGTQKSAPLDTIPLDTIPLDTIPLDTIPLDTIPLDTIGINAAVLRSSALGTI